MTDKTTTWESLANDPRIVRLKALSSQALELTRAAGLDTRKYPELDDIDWLDRVLSRASSRFTIIVIGQVSAGKSSFINSLLGRKLILPSARPTDGVISVLLAAPQGDDEFAEKILSNGVIERFQNINDAMRFIRQEETAIEDHLACREVRIHLQEPWLRNLRIVNTPGLGDRLEAFEKTALRYLHEDESDLVVWIFFPEAAANSDEVGHFHEALSRRHGAVIGVVARSLEGKEEDSTYDPHSDPSLVGDSGVKAWLNTQLGQYLKDVIFYDSHVARRLVEQMRRNPSLQSDPKFVAMLDRSGYTKFQNSLSDSIGNNREQVQEARAASVLARCRGHAIGVADAAKAAEQAFLREAKAHADQIAAWEKVDRDVIRPARAKLRDALLSLSKERSKELVTLMGNSASDAIEENFGLLETLGRSLASWTSLCDSAADALNKKIAEAVDSAISNARYYKRLDRAMQDLIREHLLALEMDLKQAWQRNSEGALAENLKVDAGRPAGNASDALGEALSGALKGVVAAVLKALASNLEQRAAAEAAKAALEHATKNVVGKAAQKAAETAAKKAAEEAGKQAAQKAAGASIARYATVITLVLIPFDVSKLVSDFKKSRQNLREIVAARYQADRPLYDSRIFDELWPIASEALSSILSDARASLGERKERQAELFSLAQDAVNAREAIQELSARFAENIRG